MARVSSGFVKLRIYVIRETLCWYVVQITSKYMKNFSKGTDMFSESETFTRLSSFQFEVTVTVLGHKYSRFMFHLSILIDTLS